MSTNNLINIVLKNESIICQGTKRLLIQHITLLGMILKGIQFLISNHYSQVHSVRVPSMSQIDLFEIIFWTTLIFKIK